MYRLRIEFRKTGDLRFLSHLDLIRAFERGLRRAALPLSLSEGFSPRPKISFGPPLPVGVSSESEYVDAMLDEHISLEDVAARLNIAFPSDLSYCEVRYVPLDAPSLMSLITLASYRIVLSVEPPLTSDEIRGYIDSLMSRKEVAFLVRDKEKQFQISQIMRKLDLEGVEGNVLTFAFLGLASSAGGVRPDILINKLFSLADRSLSVEFQEVRRTGLYREENGRLVKL